MSSTIPGSGRKCQQLHAHRHTLMFTVQPKLQQLRRIFTHLIKALLCDLSVFFSSMQMILMWQIKYWNKHAHIKDFIWLLEFKSTVSWRNIFNSVVQSLCFITIHFKWWWRNIVKKLNNREMKPPQTNSAACVVRAGHLSVSHNATTAPTQRLHIVWP